MSAETILSTSWRVLCRHWRYLGVIAAANFLITLIVSVASTFLGLSSLAAVVVASGAGLHRLVLLAGILGLLVLLAALVAPIITGASLAGAAAAVADTVGSPIAPYRTALGRYGRLAVVLGLAGSVVLAGLCLLVVPGVVVAVACFAAPYLAVTTDEPLGALAARSAALGKAHAGTILLLLLALGALSFGIPFLLGRIPSAGPLLAGCASALIGVYGALAMTVFGAHALRHHRS